MNERQRCAIGWQTSQTLYQGGVAWHCPAGQIFPHPLARLCARAGGGLEIKQEQLPVKHTDCRFGGWFYGDGRSLFGHLEIFHEVELPHQMLHEIYAQIHHLVLEGRLNEAQARLNDLMAISRTLLEQIELLESEIESSYQE